MASDSNTRLGGVKLELPDLKKAATSIDTKFDVISNRLNAIEENFQKHVNDVITKELKEGVMRIKDSIIDFPKRKILGYRRKFNILKRSYQMLKLQKIN